MNPRGTEYAEGKKEKMARLIAALEEQFAESAKLNAAIARNSKELGYGG